MLPSKGYFDSINCPYFDSGSCDRPHCHFRHVKREKTEKPNEASLTGDVIPGDSSSKPNSLLEHLVTEAVKQVLSHSEVREKAEGSVDTNAIVSDVVNKLQPSIGVPCDVQTSTENTSSPISNIPSYKPTPIAELKKRHIPVMYAPEKPTVSVRKERNLNLHVKEKLKYVPQVLDGANKSIATYKPSPADKINKSIEYAPDGDVGNHAYIPSKINNDPCNTNEIVDDCKPKGTAYSDNRELIDDFTIDKIKLSDQSYPQTKLGNVEHVLGREFNGRYSPSCSNKSDSSLQKECTVTKAVSGKLETPTSSGFIVHDFHSSSIENPVLTCAISDINEKGKGNISLENSKEIFTDDNKASVEGETNINIFSISHSRNQKHHKSDHRSTSKHKSHSHSKKSKHKEKYSDSKGKSSHKSRNEKHNSKKYDRHSSKHKYDKLKSVDRSNSKSCKSKSVDKADSHSSKKSPIKGSRKQASEVEKRRPSLDGSSSSDPIELVLSDDPIVIGSSPELHVSDAEQEEETVEAVNFEEYVEPPIKKRISHINSGDINEMSTSRKQKSMEIHTPTKTLCDRWRKARQALHKSPSHGKMRISSVPNVSSLLNAREKIMKAASASRDIEDEIENPLPKVLQRVAHVPPVASTTRPVVEICNDSRVPIAVRQTCLNNIYDEYLKFSDHSTASRRALSEEKDISKRLKVTQTYQNAVAVAILRIRRTKGDIKKDSVITENLKSDSIPDYTYGVTLYECFAKYILPPEELIVNGYPIEVPGKTGCAYIDKSARYIKVVQPKDPYQRICFNCMKNYVVDDSGFPTTENDCFYHWSKTYRTKVQGNWTAKYGCCGAEIGSDPCTSGKYHISEVQNYDCLEGFVKTKPLAGMKSDTCAGIYAIDCEMCFTVKGLEITRCTLVDLNGDTYYNKMILPELPIIDYCTRFSGVTEESLKGVTDRLSDIQKDLLEIINSKTILIGHSLENDLKALKILHECVIDTSIVFPHKMGPPRKRALRHLTEEILKMKIQNQESGHDSAEDARACLDLMMWRIKEDAKLRKPRVILSLA